ncbi:hypothetical protein D0T84_20985 [Dysgonomonas sp. 521]|uniref:hypothetical protein n=1 Tax=Dysgonomonas sp. 521 TaxID=2302932 RepID=UPI0013D38D7D|nr:hypothetical protein [Dysgonomonas sp. 521]NDV97353.1 hypothetical protein [Dysgonomonas sp. 521]
MKNGYIYNLFFNFEETISRKKFGIALIAVFLVWYLYVNFIFYMDTPNLLIYYPSNIIIGFAALYIPYTLTVKRSKGINYSKAVTIFNGISASLFFPCLIYLFILCGSIFEKAADKNYYGLESSEQVLLSISLAGMFLGIISIHRTLKQE